jgi:hypothetical protein
MSRHKMFAPKFNNSIASTTYDSGDPNSYANKMARADGARMKAIMEHVPLHQRELWQHQAATKNKKRMRAKSQPVKDERLEAERRMLEAMRHVVSTLEFHLEELHRTRKMGNEKGLVNQYGIHNALVLLRTKCGVRFDPNEYDHSLHIAEVLRGNRRTAEQVHDDIVSEREQQRLSRLRNMRSIAERFITKYRAKS